jgi:hypothetical protein
MSTLQKEIKKKNFWQEIFLQGARNFCHLICWNIIKFTYCLNIWKAFWKSRLFCAEIEVYHNGRTIRSLKIYISRKFCIWLTQEIFIFGFCYQRNIFSRTDLKQYITGFVQNLKVLECPWIWKQKFKALNVLEFVKKYLNVLEFFLL